MLKIYKEIICQDVLHVFLVKKVRLKMQYKMQQKQE